MAVSCLSSTGHFHRSFDYSESETSADGKYKSSGIQSAVKLEMPTEGREMAGKSVEKNSAGKNTNEKPIEMKPENEDRILEEVIMKDYLDDPCSCALCIRFLALIYLAIEATLAIFMSYVILCVDRFAIQYRANWSHIAACSIAVSAIVVLNFAFELIRLNFMGNRSDCQRINAYLFHWSVEAIVALVNLVGIGCYFALHQMAIGDDSWLVANFYPWPVGQWIFSIIFVSCYYIHRHENWNLD